MAHCWLVCGFIDTQVRRYEDSQRCLPMHQTACFWNCCPTGTIQKKNIPSCNKKVCVWDLCVVRHHIIRWDLFSPPPPHVVSGQSHIVHTARPNRVLPFGQKAPKHHHNTNKEQARRSVFQIAAHNEAGGPAHGQCSDLCLSKPWDNCVTYYKETVPVRDRNSVGYYHKIF